MNRAFRGVGSVVFTTPPLHPSANFGCRLRGSPVNELVTTTIQKKVILGYFESYDFGEDNKRGLN